MKSHTKFTQLLVAIALVTIAAVWWAMKAPQASAHEGRTVGEYEITFGWQVEPAYVGVYNGPELFINQKGATEDDEVPVEGLEKTLKLKVTLGGQSKELTLKPAWQEPGHYVAQLTPTRPGDYSFQLTGSISTTTAVTTTVVNEKFTSADGEFSSVEPASDVLFPDSKLDLVALQAQIDALKKEVEALKAAAK